MDEKEAIRLLKKYSKDDVQLKKVLDHSRAVQKAALRIGKELGADLEFISIGSLLHDIGRFFFNPGSKDSIRHGIKGAEILRKEGLERFADVAERHIGAGIKKKDIERQKLNLPAKDFVPVSLEEKIIAYADNLIFGTEERKIGDVIERFRKELGEEYARRVRELHTDLFEV